MTIFFKERGVQAEPLGPAAGAPGPRGGQARLSEGQAGCAGHSAHRSTRHQGAAQVTGRRVTTRAQQDARKTRPRTDALLRVLGLAAGVPPSSLATEGTRLALFPPSRLGVRMQ